MIFLSAGDACAHPPLTSDMHALTPFADQQGIA